MMSWQEKDRQLRSLKQKTKNEVNRSMDDIKEFTTEKCSLLPMGSGREGNDLHFSINTTEKIDKIMLFQKGTKKAAGYAVVDESKHFGNLYALKVKNGGRYDYALMSGERYVRDEYAKIVNRYRIGEDAEILETYTAYESNFDWEDDRQVFHPFEDTVMYRLHVKGFTKHASSKVENKGCYGGIVEKIPYLKELGVNSVELMPAYEYEDYIASGSAKGKKNYWGYGSANYFAPKASFSKKGKGTQVTEFKQMVKELHKNDMEVIMEFHFVDGMSPFTIIDVLRFWVLEYHIDGIHVNFNVAPLNMIKSDPVISMVKILCNYDSGESLESYNLYQGNKRFAILDEGFLANQRRFIKSDDGQVPGMMEQIRKIPSSYATIHYLSNHNTMSLMDAVSYDGKHNEANGEHNTDGSDYNFSWNCGIEGVSRKKKVQEMRKQQIKNAITLLMLSQGTPMIYAGDEMGKSCKGNNNPYCQDNEISWLNWNDLKSNQEIFEYMKQMIIFRKENKVLHQNQEPRQMDTLSCGWPDLSYHGYEPWKVDISYNSRCFAFMYYGEYGNLKDADIYVACNMNWDRRTFAVPYVDKKRVWKLHTATSKGMDETVVERMITVEPRSICVLVSETPEDKKD